MRCPPFLGGARVGGGGPHSAVESPCVVFERAIFVAGGSCVAPDDEIGGDVAGAAPDFGGTIGRDPGYRGVPVAEQDEGAVCFSAVWLIHRRSGHAGDPDGDITYGQCLPV